MIESIYPLNSFGTYSYLFHSTFVLCPLIEITALQWQVNTLLFFLYYIIYLLSPTASWLHVLNISRHQAPWCAVSLSRNDCIIRASCLLKHPIIIHTLTSYLSIRGQASKLRSLAHYIPLHFISVISFLENLLIPSICSATFHFLRSVASIPALLLSNRQRQNDRKRNVHNGKNIIKG